MKHAAAPGCAALFEPAALAEALLDVQTAVALARAEAGLQPWAAARETEAARRLDGPVGQDLLDTALLLQLRRGLRLVEAEAFMAAELLLAQADATGPGPARSWLARGLALLLGGIDPLRRAAAGLSLPFAGAEAVAALLGRRLGLAWPRGRPDDLQALPGLLVDAHGAIEVLRQAMQEPGRASAPSSASPQADDAEAERLLAHWRHRLPHLLPLAYDHGDPRVPVD